MSTELERWFDPDAYEVVTFGDTMYVTLEVATAQSSLPPKPDLEHGHRILHYCVLRAQSPQIYATRPDGRWLTFDVEAHGSERYLSHREHRRGGKFVLLRALAAPALRAPCRGIPRETVQRRAFGERKRLVAEHLLGDALAGRPVIEYLRLLRGIPLCSADRAILIITGADRGRVTLGEAASDSALVCDLDAVEMALEQLRTSGVCEPHYFSHDVFRVVAAILLSLPSTRVAADNAVELSVAHVPATLPEDDLDRIVRTRARVEQRVARQYLFGPAKRGWCALCGEELPADLLIAAHIKPRHAATAEERRDLANILMAACALGCDQLYERGYLSVDSTGCFSVTYERCTTQAVAAHLARLRGRPCKAFTPRSARYFSWHRKNLTRAS